MKSDEEHPVSESRLQRSTVLGTFPGALPQAENENAPLALNKYLRAAKRLTGTATDRPCDVRPQESDSQAMKLRLSDGNLIALRAIVTGGFIGAFLFALVLSAAPQLHERIHQPGGATHECAVTLLTAGSCEHAPCDAIAIAPQPPQPPSNLVQRHFQLVSPRLEFSLLEHAPPAIS